MSIGALELQSLFRKYQGQLADLDLRQNQSEESYKNTTRDLGLTRDRNKKQIADLSAARNMTHSGNHLEQQVDLEKAYDRSMGDADRQQKANLANIAKLRLDAQSNYNEGVALSKMQSLLRKQELAAGV